MNRSEILGTEPHQRRRRVLVGLLLVFALAFGVQAVMADTTGSVSATNGSYPGATLISVQDYDTDGRLIEVSQDGSLNWEYDPEDSRVFDAEYLDNGNVLVSVAEHRTPPDCPDEQLVVERNRCVFNRVLELDGDSLRSNETEIVWSYEWYDEFIHNHEVHDADRLASGETAIIDMGNNRAFTVAQNGTITWQWNATDRLGQGSAFDEEYDSPVKEGPESDWTHMNDIDKLENGNFQLSIRNFDVVIEVDPSTNDVVDVIGSPGDTDFLHRQHNPHRLSEWGTIIVADSENDRIVEYNLETGEPVWKYGGKGLLLWPRDGDRLPNGNTLITDSLNNRVVEVNPQGEVVWEYSGIDLPYEADRKGVPEEGGRTVPGWELDSEVREASAGIGTIRQLEGWAAYVFPTWIRLPELLTMFGIAAVSLVLGLDLLWSHRHTVTAGVFQD